MVNCNTIRKKIIGTDAYSSRAKKRKHKKTKSEDKDKTHQIVDEDAIKHGSWWKTTKLEEITGSIAIEFNKQCYIKALDNGLFTLGAPHDEGDGPSPEEVLTAILINESKVAFKSGYGKYVNVDNDNIVTGRADAVGQKEQWEIVFDEGKLAILSANGCFMSVDPEDDTVVALRKKATNLEHAIIRSCAARATDTADEIPTEEKGNLNQVEINYMYVRIKVHPIII